MTGSSSVGNIDAPSEQHDVILAVKQLMGKTLPIPEGGVRAVLINPRDVLDYGAAYVVARAQAAGITHLIVTVKSTRGYLYFKNSVAPDRTRGDVLTPLTTAASGTNIQVWAAFSSLADRLTANAHPDWTQRLNNSLSGSTSYPNYVISPCIADYRSYLNSLVDALAKNHDLQGLVLLNHYFSNSFGNDGTVGHAECPQSPADWPGSQLTALAQTLFNTARTHRPSLSRILASYPLGTENRYSGLAPKELGHQTLTGLKDEIDHYLLVFLGTYWVPKAAPYWETAIANAGALLGKAPLTSFYFSDEWIYPPRFYRALQRWARQQGASGFCLHTALSAFGELSPALRRAHWRRLEALAFP